MFSFYCTKVYVEDRVLSFGSEAFVCFPSKCSWSVSWYRANDQCFVIMILILKLPFRPNDTPQCYCLCFSFEPFARVFKFWYQHKQIGDCLIQMNSFSTKSTFSSEESKSSRRHVPIKLVFTDVCK